MENLLKKCTFFTKTLKNSSSVYNSVVVFLIYLFFYVNRLVTFERTDGRKLLNKSQNIIFTNRYPHCHRIIIKKPLLFDGTIKDIFFV